MSENTKDNGRPECKRMPREEHRLQMLWIDPQIVVNFVMGRPVDWYRLPEDVDVGECHYDPMRGAIGVRIASATFDVVPFGDVIPTWAGEMYPPGIVMCPRGAGAELSASAIAEMVEGMQLGRMMTLPAGPLIYRCSDCEARGIPLPVQHGKADPADEEDEDTEHDCDNEVSPSITAPAE